MVHNSYKKKKPTTLFAFVEKILRLPNKPLSQLSGQYLIRLYYTSFLLLAYVWSSHYYERNMHQISQLQPKADGLRVQYMELQATYRLKTHQSVVAKKAAKLGLYPSDTPPYIIIEGSKER